jgi:hypothetical protein
LVVDGSAINALLQIPKGKKTPGNNNNPYKINDPKAYLDNWFRRSGKNSYIDHRHAGQIARHADFKRLRARTNEFPRFENSLQQAQCAPPLAWM